MTKFSYLGHFNPITSDELTPAFDPRLVSRNRNGGSWNLDDSNRFSILKCLYSLHCIVVVDRRRCGCHVRCHSNTVRYILLHVVQGWVTCRLTFEAQEIVTCVELSLDYMSLFNDRTQV